MLFKSSHVALLLLVGAEGIACSAGGGPGSVVSPPFLRQPSEQTLCRVEIGSSTLEQTRAIIGEPSNISQTPYSLEISYAFGDVLRGPQTHLIIDFSDGIALEPFTSGFPFPDCWEEDLLALSERAAAERFNPFER